jgi:putative addiction module component (TIGR02574 family)
MATVTEMMDNLLDLPRVDRSYLVKKLLESLEQTESLTADQRSMIDRRSSEMADGKVKPLSMEQLKQEVANRLA